MIIVWRSPCGCGCSAVSQAPRADMAEDDIGSFAYTVQLATGDRQSGRPPGARRATSGGRQARYARVHVS